MGRKKELNYIHKNFGSNRDGQIWFDIFPDVTTAITATNHVAGGFLYVLELDNGYFRVGSSENIHWRLVEHKSKKSPFYNRIKRVALYGSIKNPIETEMVINRAMLQQSDRPKEFPFTNTAETHNCNILFKEVMQGSDFYETPFDWFLDCVIDILVKEHDSGAMDREFSHNHKGHKYEFDFTLQ